MTGRELIQLQATLHAMPRQEGRELADALLDRVGLTHAADRRVGTYSGGMRRRLDLASALVHAPRSSSSTSPPPGSTRSAARRSGRRSSKLNDEGTTVFLTTQYLEEADQLADRVGIITAGKLVAEGTPAALKAEVGRPHLELSLADQEGEQRGREEVLARFGRPMPARDGMLMVELEHGASEVGPIVRGPGRGGLRGRVARPRAARRSTTSSSPRRGSTSRARRDRPRGRGRSRAGTGGRGRVSGRSRRTRASSPRWGPARSGRRCGARSSRRR